MKQLSFSDAEYGGKRKRTRREVFLAFAEASRGRGFLDGLDPDVFSTSPEMVAVMFDASHPAYSADRKVQTGWSQDFVSMKPADYHVPDRQIQVVGPDAFVSSGTEVFTIAAGSARPQISARFTDVFQRQSDGSWKIVHEHVSLPPAPEAPKP